MKQAIGKIEIEGVPHVLHVYEDEKEAEEVYELLYKDTEGVYITCAGGLYNAIVVPIKTYGT